MLQCGTALKCTSPDAGHGVGNLDAFQGDAGVKCSLFDCGQRLRDVNMLQGGTAVKCTSLDAGHGVGNLDAFQCATAAECVISDSGTDSEMSTCFKAVQP